MNAGDQFHSTYLCNLQILSPVHIGSGESYKKNIDFLLSKNSINIVDSQKLLKEAAEKGMKALNSLTEAIENSSLESWCKENGVSFKKISKRHYSFREKYINKIRDIREIIRDGRGKPIVPGSSIKGAFRTALLFNMVKDDDIIHETLQKLLNQQEVKFKYADSSITKKYFGKDPNHNLMRALIVGDFKKITGSTVLLLSFVYTLTKKGTLIREKSGKEKKYDMKIFLEGFVPGNSFEGQVSFDNFLLAHCKSKKEFSAFSQGLSLEYLINAINTRTKKMIDEELEFFSKSNGNKDIKEVIAFYRNLRQQCDNLKENEAIIQLAWGSGWKAMTGPLLNPEDLTTEVRKKLKLAPKRTNFPFPKTRKVAITDQGAKPFGWVKLIFKDKAQIKLAESQRIEEKIEKRKYPWKYALEELQKINDIFLLRKKILKSKEILKWLDDLDDFNEAVKKHIIEIITVKRPVKTWGELKQVILDNELISRWKADKMLAETVKKIAKNIAKTKKKKWNKDHQREVEEWLKESGTTWNDN